MNRAPLAYALFSLISFSAHGESYFVTTAGHTMPSLSYYEKDTAFRMGGGYRFAPELSIEAAFVDLGTSAINGESLTRVTSRDLEAILHRLSTGVSVDVESMAGEVQRVGVDAAVMAESRLTRAFGVYGRIGCFAWTADQRHTLSLRVNGQAAQHTGGQSAYSGIDLVVGIGANFRFNRHLGVTLEATNYASDTLENRYLGAGMKYYF